MPRGLEQGKGILSIIGPLRQLGAQAVSFPLVCRPTHVVYRPLDSPVMDNLSELEPDKARQFPDPERRLGEEDYPPAPKENKIIGI